MVSLPIDRLQLPKVPHIRPILLGNEKPVKPVEKSASKPQLEKTDPAAHGTDHDN